VGLNLSIKPYNVDEDKAAKVVSLVDDRQITDYITLAEFINKNWGYELNYQEAKSFLLDSINLLGVYRPTWNV
jgi:hypothetical protein